MNKIKFLLLFSLLLFSREAFAVICPQILFVHAIGDSITQGVIRSANGSVRGVTSPPYGRDVGGTYSSIKSRIRGELISKGCATTQVVFKNWGFAGYRSYQFENGVIPLVMRGVNPQAENQAHFFLVMVGANDLYQGISPGATKFYVQRIVQKLKSYGVNEKQIVLSNITQNYSFSNIDRDYNPGIESVAIDEKTFFVGMYGCMQPWSGLHSGDGLHVSSSGYSKMSYCFFEKSGMKENLVRPNMQAVIAAIYLLLLADEPEEPEPLPE